MKIYVVDFEEVLKNFTHYHESLKIIQSEKQKFSDEVDSIKKEMESIINSSRLLLDDRTQMVNAEKFKELQGKGIKLESEFREHIVKLQNQELEKNFSEVTSIVEDWANNSKIDLVINKSQTLFVQSKIDATEIIITMLKDKGLYQEYNESEYLIESE